MKSRILVFIGIRHCKLIINDWIFNWKFGAGFIMYRGTMLAVMCEAWAITSIRRQVITMRFDCNRHMKKQWVFEDYWGIIQEHSKVCDAIQIEVAEEFSHAFPSCVMNLSAIWQPLWSYTSVGSAVSWSSILWPRVLLFSGLRFQRFSELNHLVTSVLQPRECSERLAPPDLLIS